MVERIYSSLSKQRSPLNQTLLLLSVGSASSTANSTIKTIKLDRSQFLKIDKSQFQKAPEFAQIAGYINTPNNAPITLASLKGNLVL